MTLLVTYASKHGSTQEIAERIAAKLRQMGQEADVHPVDEVLDAHPLHATRLLLKSLEEI